MLTFVQNPASFYRRLAAWGLHRIEFLPCPRTFGAPWRDLFAHRALAPLVYDELRRIGRVGDASPVAASSDE